MEWCGVDHMKTSTAANGHMAHLSTAAGQEDSWELIESLWQCNVEAIIMSEEVGKNTSEIVAG